MIFSAPWTTEQQGHIVKRQKPVFFLLSTLQTLIDALQVEPYSRADWETRDWFMVDISHGFPGSTAH